MLDIMEAHRVTQAVVDAMMVPLEQQDSIALMPSQIGIERERNEWTLVELRHILLLVAGFTGANYNAILNVYSSELTRNEEIKSHFSGFSFYIRRSESGKPVLYLAPPGFTFEGRYGD